MELVLEETILGINEFTENEYMPPNFKPKWKPLTLKTTH